MREVQGEVVIYDEERFEAHHLNRTAALVWSHCDGQTSVPEIAALLQKELNPAADEDLVWMSVGDLEAAHLMQEMAPAPQEQVLISRREVVRKAGLVGALSLLIPVVTSMVAPTPAAAHSRSGEEGEEGDEGDD